MVDKASYAYVELYEELGYYEDVYHSARLYEDAIYVDEETSEHAPGNRYGLRYEVKGPAFEVFKDALTAEGGNLADAVRHEFSGKYGINKFRDFCRHHGVNLTTYRI